MSIILFLIILGVLVVSHEFGHFIVAKLSGMRVDEFGFGFPPRLFGFKKGETTYSINAIPFGGFVKIWGEDAPENVAELPEYSRSFAGKPKHIQAAVVVAGIVFNFLLAWILISIGFMAGMPTSTEDTSLGIVENAHVVITDVLKNSPAEKAGLKAGDEIATIAGGEDTIIEPKDAKLIQDFIFAHGEGDITLGYRRGDDTIHSSTLKAEVGITPDHPAIGVALDSLGIVRLSPPQAIFQGAKLTFDLTKATVLGLAGFVRDLFTSKTALDGVTGPVGLIGLVGSSAAFGLVYLLGLTAIISINLGIMNLIPFPALDGGRLLFITIEKIKGSPIKPHIANGINAAGFFSLLALMAFITWHDVAKLVTG